MSHDISYTLITPPSTIDNDTDDDGADSADGDDTRISHYQEHALSDAPSHPPSQGPFNTTYNTTTVDEICDIIHTVLSPIHRTQLLKPYLPAISLFCLVASAMASVYLYHLPTDSDAYRLIQRIGYIPFPKLRHLYAWVSHFYQSQLTYFNFPLHVSHLSPTTLPIHRIGKYLHQDDAYSLHQPLMLDSIISFTTPSLLARSFSTIGHIITSLWFSYDTTPFIDGKVVLTISTFASILVSPIAYTLLLLLIVILLLVVCWYTIMNPSIRDDIHSRHLHLVAYLVPHLCFSIMYQYQIFSSLLASLWMIAVPFMVVFNILLSSLCSRNNPSLFHMPIPHPIIIPFLYIIHILSSSLLSIDVILHDPITIVVWYFVPIATMAYWCVHGVYLWHNYQKVATPDTSKHIITHLVSLLLLTCLLFSAYSILFPYIGMQALYILTILLWAIPSIYICEPSHSLLFSILRHRSTTTTTTTTTGLHTKTYLRLRTDDDGNVENGNGGSGDDGDDGDDDNDDDDDDDDESNSNHGNTIGSANVDRFNQHSHHNHQMHHLSQDGTAIHRMPYTNPLLWAATLCIFLMIVFVRYYSSGMHYALDGTQLPHHHTTVDPHPPTTSHEPMHLPTPFSSTFNILHPPPPNTEILQSIMDQTKAHPSTITLDQQHTHGQTASILVSTARHHSTTTNGSQRAEVDLMYHNDIVIDDDTDLPHQTDEYSPAHEDDGVITIMIPRQLLTLTISSLGMSSSYSSPNTTNGSFESSHSSGDHNHEKKTVISSPITAYLITTAHSTSHTEFIFFDHVSLEHIQSCSTYLDHIIQQDDASPSLESFQLLRFQQPNVNVMVEYLLKYEYLYGSMITSNHYYQNILSHLSSVRLSYLSGTLYAVGLVIVIIFFISMILYTPVT